MSKYDEMAREHCHQSDEDHNYYQVNKQPCPSCVNITRALASIAEQKDLLIDNHKNLKEVYFKEKEELQAKLSLAVEALQNIANFDDDGIHPPREICIARETLTQIKGDGVDDRC